MADDDQPPPDSKLTRTKEKWAREGRFLTGKITRSEDQRLPPGQHLTKDWPVLDLGVMPPVSRERWRLDVYGAVEHPVFWTYPEFAAQKQKLRRLQQCDQLAAHLHGVRAAARDELVYPAFRHRGFLAHSAASPERNSRMFCPRGSPCNQT